mgnify:CR=1 FL=1
MRREGVRFDLRRPVPNTTPAPRDLRSPVSKARYQQEEFRHQHVRTLQGFFVSDHPSNSRGSLRFYFQFIQPSVRHPCYQPAWIRYPNRKKRALERFSIDYTTAVALGFDRNRPNRCYREFGRSPLDQLVRYHPAHSHVKRNFSATHPQSKTEFASDLTNTARWNVPHIRAHVRPPRPFSGVLDSTPNA